MANVVKPNSEERRETTSLQNSYIQNTNSYNRLEERAPYDGTMDRFGDTRLRLAKIDNPEINRNKNDLVDPLNTVNVINHNNGNITLKWLDMPGGVIRPSDTGGEWKYVREKDEYYPENRDYDEWDISSRREQVSLAHPFIWADNKNYCGFNYLPPVGSVVVVGFRKLGFPVILGYIPTHYKICYPILKPGEMVMKGYGNNYTHWRWSDKIDMKAWSAAGTKDIDDPDVREQINSEPKVDTSNCTLWLRLNANDNYIVMSAEECIPEESVATQIDDSKYNNTNKYVHPKTTLILKPKEFIIQSNDGTSNTKYYQNGTMIEQTVGNTVVTITNDAHKIKTSQFIVESNNFNTSNSNTSINSAGNVSITVGGEVLFNK